MDTGHLRPTHLAVLAHELKAPINAVEGYLELLRGDLLDAKPELRVQVLDRCFLRIRGMRKFIEDLLDLTQIQSGQRVRRLAPLDLAEVARWAMETARTEATAHNIRVNLAVDEDLPPFVADRNEIEIILNNLLSNAVKYNREGGSVTVSIVREGRKAVIEVADTGIGMSKEDMKRLFHEFERIRNEKTQHVLGSGLGLSILKKLAVLYRGDVQVVSHPGKGSTFTVTLHEPEMLSTEQERAAYAFPHAS
jgi:two-component system, sensor histidine kinase and response regulator